MGLLSIINSYCEASDCIWITSRSTIRDGLTRRVVRTLLHLCAVVALVPPPPGACRSLRAVLHLLTAVAACAYGVSQLVHKMEELSHVKSGVSRYAFMVSAGVTAMQPAVVLACAVCNSRHVSPAVARVLQPPCGLRWHVPLLSVIVYLLAVGKLVVSIVLVGVHVDATLIHSSITLCNDALIIFLCKIAEGKFHALNGELRPALRGPHRGLVLESALWQYEEAVDAVAELCRGRVLGLPLLFTQIRLRFKIVTETFNMLHNFLNDSHLRAAGYSITVTALVLEIVWLGSVGDSLHRASRETEIIISSVRSKGWREQEKELSRRLIRSSRKGAKLSVGGLASVDFAFLLSAFGSCLTYLIVLLQQ